MTRHPWMKWYPSDWRSDPRLRIVSLAARGLWADMLCLMHEAEPYGHLVVADNALTEAQLAVLVGAPTDEVSQLLGELDSAGVFSRTRKGVIYSRRMTRDHKKARTAQQNGKLGGNPTLSEQRDIQASDNVKDKGGVKTQKPEARSQIPDKVSSEANASSEYIGQKIEPPPSYGIPEIPAILDRRSRTKPPPACKQANGTTKPKQSDIDAEFEAWWQHVPRKTAKGKAREKYRAARKKTDADTLLTAIKAFASSMAGKEPQYIPHPATWLYGERWLDEDASPSELSGEDLKAHYHKQFEEQQRNGQPH